MHLCGSWRRPVRTGALSIMLIALFSVAPATSHAQLSPYSQNFENLGLNDPAALSNDGWLVYGNVYSPTLTYLYGYGPFPAPNEEPPHFCRIVTGEGGSTQGVQQLSVFSDYENADHANGNLIESNVYQERMISAADVGHTWYFEFDAKLGNLVAPTTAVAFIKTLNPAAGYALTNFITSDMTSIPSTWNRYSVSLMIDAGLIGQIFQFGFANTATNYDPSGVFYDNIELTETSTVDVLPTAFRATGLELSLRGNPVAGGQGQVLAFSLAQESPVSVRIYDVTGALVATLVHRELGPGLHQVSWRGDDASGRRVPSGLYLAEVVAGRERAVAKLQRLR